MTFLLGIDRGALKTSRKLMQASWIMTRMLRRVQPGRILQRISHSGHWITSRIKTLLPTAVVALAVMTALWPDWIERVFLVDPDHHSCSVEWNLVIACALGATLVTVVTRRHWRKTA